MGTKLKPGKFDCYDAAKDDEPMFTLLARDPLAPWLVEMWADMKSGDMIRAMRTFCRMYDEVGFEYVGAMQTEAKVEKTEEAINCAREMNYWKRNNMNV
jgi:hypothetical protein